MPCLILSYDLYVYKILVKVHLLEVGVSSLIMILLKYLYIESACLKTFINLIVTAV